ncbi:MAG: NAD-dependent deacylase [Thermoproteota archaeon]|nr:NAD-dependent deacylase [Thermoproteota archaeon]
MKNEVQENMAKIRKLLHKSRKIVFLSGAGLSKESGIPTFRGQGGIWKNYDTSKLASFSAFTQNPSQVWEFYRYRQNMIAKCHPNAAHLSISAMENQGVDVWVVTQNVDGLHNRAGSKKIIELHGNIFRAQCIKCGYIGDVSVDIKGISNLDNDSEPNTNRRHVIPGNQKPSPSSTTTPSSPIFSTKCMESEKALPRCKNCKNVLKPGVVMFGEPLPKNEWLKATEVSSSCNMMVVVGTSLLVSPANTLPYYAKKNNAILVEVNLEKTWLSKMMDFTLIGTAAEILPKITAICNDQNRQ